MMRIERRGRGWVAFKDSEEEPFAMSRYGGRWFRISDGHTLSGVPAEDLSWMVDVQNVRAAISDGR